MAEGAASRSINKPPATGAEEKPPTPLEELTPKQELDKANRIASHHREIFTAMCANINPEAMTSGAKITQTIAHIRGISEVAAAAFENPAVKVA